MWGPCGRSIAGIRLYARNTGKPWSATAIAQSHHTPETYQATYIDRSTRVANLSASTPHSNPATSTPSPVTPAPNTASPPKPHTQPSTSSPKPTPSSSTKLHRQIHIRPNRPNPHPKLQPKNPHNLHPHRRPTPNLRLPQPTHQPQTQQNVAATLVIPLSFAEAKGRRSKANVGDARGGRTPGWPRSAGEMSKGQRRPTHLRMAKVPSQPRCKTRFQRINSERTTNWNYR